MRQIRSLSVVGMVILGVKAVFAYLDPGSGSLIVQLLIAAVVGILATFRFWKSRLLSLFGIVQDSDIAEDENEDEDEDAK